MGRTKKGAFDPRKAAKFHRHAAYGATGRAFRPEQENRRGESRRDPIATGSVLPMTGGADPGRAVAEEFLPEAIVRTEGSGFVSKPPKGKINQSVSVLNPHTKQVDRGTPSYRKAGKVVVSRGKVSAGADKVQRGRNIGMGD